MSGNEIEERRASQREKCLWCKHHRNTGCFSGGMQDFDIPPGDKAHWSTPRANIIDFNFRYFANGHTPARTCWLPVLAAHTCVGYARAEAQ